MKTIQLSEAVKSEIAKWNEASSISTLLSIDKNGNNAKTTPIDLFKVQRKRYVPNTGFNDATNEGAYTIADPNHALPDNPGDVTYGILCVSNSGDFLVQYIFEMFGLHRIFYRLRNEKHYWQPWMSFKPSA